MSNKKNCKNRLTSVFFCAIIIYVAGFLYKTSYHRGIAQLVEQWSPKPRAEGSNPSAPARYADVAQVVAHILGKDEVTSSSLVISSKKMSMNGLFKLFMDIFVLFEKISALESESSA